MSCLAVLKISAELGCLCLGFAIFRMPVADPFLACFFLAKVVAVILHEFLDT